MGRHLPTLLLGYAWVMARIVGEAPAGVKSYYATAVGAGLLISFWPHWSRRVERELLLAPAYIGVAAFVAQVSPWVFALIPAALMGSALALLFPLATGTEATLARGIGLVFLVCGGGITISAEYIMGVEKFFTLSNGLGYGYGMLLGRDLVRGGQGWPGQTAPLEDAPERGYRLSSGAASAVRRGKGPVPGPWWALYFLGVLATYALVFWGIVTRVQGRQADCYALAFLTGLFCYLFGGLPQSAGGWAAAKLLLLPLVTLGFFAPITVPRVGILIHSLLLGASLALVFPADNARGTRGRVVGTVMMLIVAFMTLMAGSHIGSQRYVTIWNAVLYACGVVLGRHLLLGGSSWRWPWPYRPPEELPFEVSSQEAPVDAVAPAVAAAVDSPPPVAASGEPVLVASGSFRVERGRALEVLREVQMEDAEQFLLPFIRCAVASGATRLSLEDEGRAIVMRFDGRPLPEGLIHDPYRCLFEETGPDTVRGRQFAYGLLAALRLKPFVVSAVSGQARMSLAPEGWAGAAVPEPPTAGTVIRVRWRLWKSRALRRRCLDKAAAAFGLCSAELTVRGEPVSSLPEPAEFPILGFQDGALTGLLAPAHPGPSGARLYYLGAMVCEIAWRESSLPALAYLSDERFVLNASLSGVVKDPVLAGALRAAALRVPEFLALALRRQSEVYPVLGRRLARLAWSSSKDRLWESRVAAWLRLIAVAIAPDSPEGALLAQRLEAASPGSAKAWENTPLFLSARGEGLSIPRLRSAGMIRASRWRWVRLFSGFTVWCPDDESASQLRMLFPRGVKWFGPWWSPLDWPIAAFRRDPRK